MFRMFLTLTVIALGIAFLTRPDADKTRDLFRAKVQEQIAMQDANGTRKPAENAALAICKVNTAACADLIVSATQMTYTDRKIYARVDVKGLGQTATCYGLFARLTCMGDLPGSQ